MKYVKTKENIFFDPRPLPPYPLNFFVDFGHMKLSIFSKTLKTTKNKARYPKDLKHVIYRKYFESVTRLHVDQDTGPTSGIYCYALRKAQ